MNKDKLADTFVTIIQDWLSGDEMSELRNKNKELIGSNICASHDYCDANQAMVEALGKHGIEADIQNDKQLELINKAWNTAKQNQFKTRLQQLQELGFPMLADWIQDGEISSAKEARKHLDENKHMMDDNEDRRAFNRATDIVKSIFNN